jgi:hypothetical protein
MGCAKTGASQATVGERPKPQIFAIMRNGHEVIRGGMIEVSIAVEKGDMKAAVDAWEDLAKFEAMHKTMEEGNGTEGSPIGFFRYVNTDGWRFR